MKNTFVNKSASEIFLHEFLPVSEEDVILGKGIDGNQDTLKYFDYEDLEDPVL